MSIKTSKEIERDMRKLLLASPVASAVSGSVYFPTYRPRDSKLEDITVKFMSGGTEQMQKGVVSVKIYVPDIDPYGNGVMVENGARTEELQRIVQDWLDSNPAAKTNYLLELHETISVTEYEEIQQHAVSVMLDYTLFNE